MMRTKAILILAIVTVVAVAGAAASVYQREGAHGLPQAPKKLFPGLNGKVNEVAKIIVDSPEGSFTIEKQSGGDWQMVEKGGYPVLFETIKQAVIGISEMEPQEAKTARPERYARIKVVDPRGEGDSLSKGILLRLLGADDGEIAAVIVGKTRSIQTSGRAGWYYVRKAQEPQSWLVAARIEVFDKANSWLDTDTVRIDRKRVRAVSNRQPNGDMVEISRPNPDQIDFKIDNLPDGSKMLHETIANSLGAALGYLSFDDVKPATAAWASKGTATWLLASESSGMMSAKSISPEKLKEPRRSTRHSTVWTTVSPASRETSTMSSSWKKPPPSVTA